ncbi:DNA-binding protein [Leuconostoc citreum]|uniref:DNA-binding protein n=1 Tax=Leuconostoc citreum TaxID=33964 RepID=UPI00200B2166|nr:DNA-binding protein [Leuconostoc citreum]MCK8605872.1 DNA-binding protein [Leuconostoc citreum]
MNELTESYMDRRNLLNNKFALAEINKTYNFQGIPFQNTTVYSNSQLSSFFNVTLRTIERTIEANREELESNDFRILSGKDLSILKKSILDNNIDNIDISPQTPSLAISSFRTVLNFAMLLKDSNKAQEMRSRILDITIDVLTKKAGGNVHFINQRDKNYLDKAFVEASERKTFTSALNNYVDMNQYKYAYFTDRIYTAIFKENTKEYRQILSLAKKENARATMYSEVLLLIASFEAGVAYDLKNESEKLKRKLSQSEADQVFDHFSNHPAQTPLIENARLMMASRDNALRDAYHEKLTEYINPLSEEEYEKFLGDQSKSLDRQIEEHRDVFKRLKDK